MNLLKVKDKYSVCLTSEEAGGFCFLSRRWKEMRCGFSRPVGFCLFWDSLFKSSEAFSFHRLISVTHRHQQVLRKSRVDLFCVDKKSRLCCHSNSEEQLTKKTTKRATSDDVTSIPRPPTEAAFFHSKQHKCCRSFPQRFNYNTDLFSLEIPSGGNKNYTEILLDSQQL